MRAFTIIASILPAVLAAWNQEFCNNTGACVQIGGITPNDPHRCPDGTALTLSLFANALLKTEQPGTIPVSKEEFPKTCYGNRTPGPKDRLVKLRTANGQWMYTFQTENCKGEKPLSPGNCYNSAPNLSYTTFCQLIDAKGGQCTFNPAAGHCERWGFSTVHPECEGWKIGMPDTPEPSNS